MDNNELKLAYEFAKFTNRNIFLTGKAGTGKTTFLKSLKDQTYKRMIIVAPTGVAAINAGGVTIHSFFQLPFGPIIPEDASVNSSKETGNKAVFQKFSRMKTGIMRTLDMLVIDEISMVRADLLDGVDAVLRRIRRSKEPFGGVQLLMIGDMHQLIPVVKDEDREILCKYYPSFFFFQSKALQRTDYISIELKHIYRQKDEHFIRLLNKIRMNKPDDDVLNEFNKRCNPEAEKEKGAIILTTHNYQSQAINDRRLKDLPDREFLYHADIEGEFSEYMYPVDSELKLKEGAQVMFMKNDSNPERRYFNGKIGHVVSLSGDQIIVRCENDNDDIEVNPERWENVKYEIMEETAEIKETVVGAFSQFPLKLAWAITIHKSQGLTFDKAIVDISAAFAFGQVYVALSRCRSLDGLVLRTPLSRECLKNDRNISVFSEEISQNPPDKQTFELSQIRYQQMLLQELFNFDKIERRLGYIQKIIGENRGSFGQNTLGHLQSSIDRINTELSRVSEKFIIQMNVSLEKDGIVGSNTYLNERLCSAADYYCAKCDEILKGEILDYSFNTDNKELRKQVQSVISEIENDLKMKKAGFEVCREGFEPEKFLKVRAVVLLKDEKPGRKEEKDDTYSSGNPELYKELIQWRSIKARHIGLPAYRIVRQPVLAEISEILPVSLAQLKKVKKFGAKKIMQFGPDIVKIVSGYMKKMGLEVIADDRIKNLELKKHTTAISLEMFRSGMSIEKIAKERGYVVSTIEGHLAKCIAGGDLLVDEVLDVNKIAVITEYFLNVDSYGLSHAREVLGEEYSYAELRFVFNQLVCEGKVEVKKTGN